MRLEKRKCMKVSEDESGTTYELSCSINEAHRWGPYVIDKKPLCFWGKREHYNWHVWQCTSYTDQVGTGITFDPGTEKEYTVWDDHLTFIIPKYWENKKLPEGFYAAGEYEKAVSSLKDYVRLLDTGKDYCAQYMGGPGDPEYSYLKTLCDIEDALISRDEIVWGDNEEKMHVVESILPLGCKTVITIKLPKDSKLDPTKNNF